jgi:K+-transporting ATPase KdpF subunit
LAFLCHGVLASWRFLNRDRKGAALRIEVKRGNMDYLIAGLISLALGVYLLYALLKPEKF